MKLAINGYRLEGHQTGVARYLVSLLHEWDHAPGPFTRIRLFSRNPDKDPRVPTLRTIRHVSLTPWLPYLVCEQVLLRFNAKADMLFCPANTMPVGYTGPCVVTIHDLLHEVMPETFPMWARVRHAALYKYSARHASQVLTVSENSRNDIIRIYGIPESKVRVIPLAAASCFGALEDRRPIDEARERFNIGSRPYVLFVGKLSVRRSIPMLLRAFAQLVHRLDMPHALVLVGANHLDMPLNLWLKETGLDGRVVHLPRVSDDDLVALYNGAECFVLTSLYEGFGLPVVEAMACGCPVVVFRNSSLAEVGGDAVFYPEAAEEECLAKALYTVLDSATLRADLRMRGLGRAGQFSWHRTATETLDALAQAAS